VVLVRRDTGEKIPAPIDGIAETITKMLADIHDSMYARAKEHLEKHVTTVKTYDEFKNAAENKPGFIKAHWCGCQECEDAVKEDTTATLRCIPFEGGEPEEGAVCVYCGKPAKYNAYWGKAY
ncbi:MAG: proline--tRNA ligase, partial [Oscillospiraceae bacterium]|nr:proline--tRNA ligase [Oscillospiraceae bacterium]